MFNPIILNIDSQSQQLVAYGGSVAAWPNLFQGDIRDIQVGILTPTGNAVAPYLVANLAGYSMYVTMGATPKGDGSQLIYVGPVALAWNPLLNGGGGAFSGTLNLTGANLAAAIGTNASAVATAEINISLAGTAQGLYQNQIIISAPENANGVVTPQPAVNYLTSIQTAAEFVPRGGGQAGQGRIEISPNGTKYFIFRNNDGTENVQRLN